MKNFGNRLKQLRTSKKLSQYELGKELGKSQSAICRLEKGKVKPKIPLLIAISIFFDVKCDFLLGIETSNKKKKG